MADKETKKGGLLSKLFGRKSKEEKLAAEAAEKAAAQKLVDEQMAARMAAINAAALKSAREQDDSAAAPEDKAAIEAEETRLAEEQARIDVETARRLAEEQRQKAEQIKAEEEAAEAEALEEARKKGEREAAELKAKQEAAAQEKAKEAEKIAAEEAKKQKDINAADAKAEKEAAKNTEDSKAGFLERISSGLRKSTSRMSEGVSALFTKRTLDAQALEELEDLLISSDFGIGPASKVTALLSKDKFDKHVTDMEVKVALADVIAEILTPLEKPLILSGARPQILLFVGVNGSGKTTTLGKMARRFHGEGKKVLIVAGDTFRAAAAEQLSVWGERAKAPVMTGPIGADAAGLVYDAIDRARRENFDVIMIDTAGRLQNRKELMDELSKIVRVIKKQDSTAPHHCLLVLDATVGQNALSQTEAFKETAGVTGLIMTKLDGTAKGGVLVALSDKYKLPIHAIGIGERPEDLENFSAPVFAAALSGIADSVQS